VIDCRVSSQLGVDPITASGHQWRGGSRGAGLGGTGWWSCHGSPNAWATTGAGAHRDQGGSQSQFLYATREETFFQGTRQALLNHTERMLQLEREYVRRFPERTKADALRTRKGSRSQAGQPTGR
jgi:hypothetical protein